MKSNKIVKALKCINLEIIISNKLRFINSVTVKNKLFLTILFICLTFLACKNSDNKSSIILEKAKNNQFTSCIDSIDLVDYDESKIYGCGNLIIYKSISSQHILMLKLDIKQLNITENCTQIVFDEKMKGIAMFIYYFEHTSRQYIEECSPLKIVDAEVPKKLLGKKGIINIAVKPSNYMYPYWCNLKIIDAEFISEDEKIKYKFDKQIFCNIVI